ncbi:hypothetical protein P153DRAFT_299258 [Dothidotthia symphoricarpi CBS 119687]|uniref:Mitochondrial export protein Som1 n=1 Tax=Dothidotthia symphoricarpi CBS 119687 TaxID=1392245 RepID=A0A6A6A536_9PLEO|nr:uncharacterized protein P153DRAFT_299258 [Dothidotthia symphoricarpi CBS 119687]KAF2125878.1 hypothetical protein P153DRAFT_299258 [Dothidotthia symphoricarpi CBS 119687]
MPPPTPIHALSTLEAQINVLPSGKPRRPPIKLGDCALKELVQYKCNIVEPEVRGEKVAEKGKGVVVCEPVVRLLRQCAGGVSVETTAWEGRREKAKMEG